MQGSKQAACLILDPWPLLGNNASVSILTHVAAQNNHTFRCLERFHKAERNVVEKVPISSDSYDFLGHTWSKAFIYNVEILIYWIKRALTLGTLYISHPKVADLWKMFCPSFLSPEQSHRKSAFSTLSSTSRHLDCPLFNISGIFHFLHIFLHYTHSPPQLFLPLVILTSHNSENLP